METAKLLELHCVPCRGGVLRLRGEELRALHEQLGGEWAVVNEHHLEREYTFKNFREAMVFANRVAELAEQEGHHPELQVGWGYVRVLAWTHKADGLTQSDFVLAAKVDKM
jgi:4a-hydroxytetrahydrobiopterin dehydratase